MKAQAEAKSQGVEFKEEPDPPHFGPEKPNVTKLVLKNNVLATAVEPRGSLIQYVTLLMQMMDLLEMRAARIQEASASSATELAVGGDLQNAVSGALGVDRDQFGEYADLLKGGAKRQEVTDTHVRMVVEVLVYLRSDTHSTSMFHSPFQYAWCCQARSCRAQEGLVDEPLIWLGATRFLDDPRPITN